MKGQQTEKSFVIVIIVEVETDVIDKYRKEDYEAAYKTCNKRSCKFIKPRFTVEACTVAAGKQKKYQPEKGNYEKDAPKKRVAGNRSKGYLPKYEALPCNKK